MGRQANASTGRVRAVGFLGVAMVLVALGAVAFLVVSAVDTSPETTTVDADLSTWLDERGGLRVGWSSSLQPVSVVENGEVTGGYAVEAWDLAARRLGIDLQHVAYPDAAALSAALDTGEIDVVGAYGSHPALADGHQASTPYAWSPGVFVGLSEQTPLGTAELSGRTYTTLPGAVFRDEIDRNYPGGTYVLTEDPVQALQAVAAGEIDLFYGPLAFVGFHIGRLDLDLVPVGEHSGIGTVQSWAVPGTQAAMAADRIRAALTDSDLAVLHVLWTGFDLTEPVDGSQVPSWMIPVLLTFAAVVSSLLLFTAALRRRIRVATTELRSMNEDLEDVVAQRTVALVQSNQALGRFAATAAHDLKGPINAISGLSELLLDDVVPEEDRAQVIQRVGASAGRLSSMIDAMLEDAVSIGVSTDFLDGPAFEAWLREVAGPELSIIAADLRIEVPYGMLDLDTEVLRRCALNLIDNATKYAANLDGTVIEVDLRRQNDTWRMSVADNGPGIPKARWGTIFDRGSRLVHDDRGFGLGLGAIRDLVQGAGGSIRTSKAHLGGADFIIELPQTQVHGHAVEAVHARECEADGIGESPDAHAFTGSP